MNYQLYVVSSQMLAQTGHFKLLPCNNEKANYMHKMNFFRCQT